MPSSKSHLESHQKGAAVHVMSAIPGVALSAVAGVERSAIMVAAKDDVNMLGAARRW